MGSQSVAGTVGILWGLRMTNVLGCGALSLWCMSPLGGQSALRLISIDTGYVTTSNTVYYANDRQWSWLGESDFDGVEDAVNALFFTALLSSPTATNSTTDLWGNLRIPVLDGLREGADQPSVTVEHFNWTAYSSLLGVPIMGLQGDVNTTFTIKTGYFGFQCGDLVQHDLTNSPQHLREFLGPLQFHWFNGTATVDHTVYNITKLITEASKKWVDPLVAVGGLDMANGLKSWFLDTNTPLISNNVSLLSNSTTLGVSRFPSTPAIRPLFPNVTFVYMLDTSFNLWETTVCEMDYIRVDANVTCTGLSCRITSMRRAPLDEYVVGTLMDVALSQSGSGHLDFSLFRSMCHYFPLAVSSFGRNGSFASAIGRYLSGMKNPFSYINISPFSDVSRNNTGTRYFDMSGVSPDIFTEHFSTLFNTYWQATQGTGCRTEGFLPACIDHNRRHEKISSTLVSNATFTRAQDFYKIEPIWFTIFVAITFVLYVCAGAGLILEYLCSGPDILGYVSTMTRDNAYTPLPSAASTLDGPKRARLLKNYRVRDRKSVV